MTDVLYRIELLRLAADAHGAGRLATPHITGHAFNPTCGDRVIVDLTLADGRVTDIAHDTKACLLAQASASVLGRYLRGADRAAIAHLRTAIVAMLETSNVPPAEPFAAYSAFAGAVEFRSRHGCVLLPLDAVLAALDASEKSEPGGIRTEG